MSQRFVKEYWPRTVEVEKGTACPAGSLSYLSYDTSDPLIPDVNTSPYYFSYPVEATECSRKRVNGERNTFPGVF